MLNATNAAMELKREIASGELVWQDGRLVEAKPVIDDTETGELQPGEELAMPRVKGETAELQQAA